MSIIRAAVAVIEQQRRISRNLNEGWRVKTRRMFWCCVYLCWGYVVAVQWLRREVLGERVRYKGRICYVYNWANLSHVSLRWSDGFAKDCERSEIQTIRSPATYWFRMQSGFVFYTTNWLKIDVQKRLLQDGSSE